METSEDITLVAELTFVIGGPPCQATSVAAAASGKRTGATLWPEMLRVVVDAGPEWVVSRSIAARPRSGNAGHDDKRKLVQTGKETEDDMAQWIINGRFTFDGHAVVEAETTEEARTKFNSGDFEFDAPTASCADWEARGKPEGPH